MRSVQRRKPRGDAVDIVIVNYKSTELLLRCLKSIEETADGLRCTVIVQDNSMDDGVDCVRDHFPRVVVNKSERNLGFAKGVNRGLECCAAPYVLLLNPDTIVCPGFFETTLRYMRENPQVGVLGPKILDHDGTVQGSARGFPTPLTAFFGRRSVFSKLFPGNPITRENVRTMDCDGQTPMEVDWVSGACMVVRMDAVREVGPLDEQFFMYWEDTDWCRRMWSKGWKVVYFPPACITHFIGGSSEKNVFRSVTAFHQSSYKLFDKYLSTQLGFYKPFVFTGMIMRCLFVLASQGLSRSVRRLRGPYLLERARKEEEETRKIRILRLIARLNIGGPAIYVHLLTRDMDPERFETTLVTGKISPQEGDMSYLFDDVAERIVHIPELQREINPLLDLVAFGKIVRLILSLKPDIIDTHTAKAGTTARVAATLCSLVGGRRIQTVHTFHGHVFEGYFSRSVSDLYVRIERILAACTDVIIAISPSQKRELAQKFQIAPDEKIQSIPLGFRLSAFAESAGKRGAFKRSLGVPADAPLVGIIGRLVPIKNHRLFFDAARICLERGNTPDVRFAVIGDGEMRAELEAYCRHLGISDRVRFTGWMRDLTGVYADLDALALTSDNEGTPVSIIEAMAASVPVISTAAGGVVDLLGALTSSPGNTRFVLCEHGVLCARKDPVGFSEGLDFLLGGDAAARNRLVESARAFVLREFSEERLLGDLERLYAGLAARNGGRPRKADAPKDRGRVAA